MFLSISKTLAQQIVDTIHDVCQYHINFITTDGMIYASSDPSRIGTFHEIGKQVASTGKTIEVDSDNIYPGTHKGINIPIYYHREMVAIVGISGDIREVTRFAHLAERISHILLHEKELVAIHRSLDEKKLYVIQSLQSQGLDKNLYFLDCIHTFHLHPSDIFWVVTIEVNTRYNLVNISLLEQDIQRFLASLNESVFAYIYPNKFIALIRNQTFQSHFEKSDDETLPSFLAAIAGPVVVIILLALRVIIKVAVDPMIALPVGGVVCTLVTGKITKFGQFAEFGLGKVTGVSILLLGTGTIAGIIKASALQIDVVNLLNFLHMPAFLLAPIAGILMAGATTSTTAGATVASQTFSGVILSQGIPAIAAGAMIHAGATVIDSLPHGSFFHATGGAVNMDISNRMKLIVYEAIVGLTTTVVAVLMYVIIH